MAPALTVAIPTFNDDPRVFTQVLDRVAEHGGGAPVVVVDMSTDDGVRAVCARRPEVRYDAFADSGGVAPSRNRCVELAETRGVAFVDSDALVEPGWLDALDARL